MRGIILILMIVSLIFISGCADPFARYQCWDGSVVDSLDKCPPQEVRKSCRELGGYLCESSDSTAYMPRDAPPPASAYEVIPAAEQCAVDWLNSTDSYCCPIECKRCTDEQWEKCKSPNPCVNFTCNAQTSFQCEEQIIPWCSGNGLCENRVDEDCQVDPETGEETCRGSETRVGDFIGEPYHEFEGMFHPPILTTWFYYTNPPGEGQVRGHVDYTPCYLNDEGGTQVKGERISRDELSEWDTSSINYVEPSYVTKESSGFVPNSPDCPTSCDDGSPLTVDYYDFTNQTCVNELCDFVCGNRVCEEDELFLVNGTVRFTACYDDCKVEWDALYGNQ